MLKFLKRLVTRKPRKGNVVYLSDRQLNAREYNLPHTFVPQSYPDEDLCEVCDHVKAHALHAEPQQDAA